MARIEFRGAGEMEAAFQGIADEIDDIADDMLNAMGDVVVPAQKRTAASMLRGAYYKGAVMASITKSRVKLGKKGGKIMFIEFVGTQHGEDLSTIAYINEYGKTNQPARPFIEAANEQSEVEAVEKAASVLFNHYKGKGL